MLFVWSIDFFLFCIVVFVGFVICFLVSWYTSFFILYEFVFGFFGFYGFSCVGVFVAAN